MFCTSAEIKSQETYDANRIMQSSGIPHLENQMLTQEQTQDLYILKQTMDFALGILYTIFKIFVQMNLIKFFVRFFLDIQNELFNNYLNTSESNLVHQIAGPPYFEDDPQLPNIMAKRYHHDPI